MIQLLNFRFRIATQLSACSACAAFIVSGAPTFRGTRVLVRTLFDYIEAGHSLERFLAGFPTVSREQALQALEEAKASLLASH
jgi:uncharacterized protein (DUF433 family)